MFQLMITPKSIEKVTIQLFYTSTKVYAIGARLFLSKVLLEVLQNWVLIQLIVTAHILGKVQGQIKGVCRLIEPCLLIGTTEYPRNSRGGGGPLKVKKLSVMAKQVMATPAWRPCCL